MYTTLQQNIRTLKTLNQPIEHWDSILIYLTIRCLDSASVRAWEMELGSTTDNPKLSQLYQFILCRMRSLQALDRASTIILPLPVQVKAKSYFLQGTVNPSTATSVNKNCAICLQSHQTMRCPEYSFKSRDHKLELIKKHSLCYNCLGSHLSNACPSPRRCLKCGKKHHTTIHGSDERSPTSLLPNPISPLLTNTGPRLQDARPSNP